VIVKDQIWGNVNLRNELLSEVRAWRHRFLRAAQGTTPRTRDISAGRGTHEYTFRQSKVGLTSGS